MLTSSLRANYLTSQVHCPPPPPPLPTHTQSFVTQKEKDTELLDTYCSFPSSSITSPPVLCFQGDSTELTSQLSLTPPPPPHHHLHFRPQTPPPFTPPLKLMPPAPLNPSLFTSFSFSYPRTPSYTLPLRLCGLL